MENKRKLNLKLKLVPIFFLAVSFLSITLAWFAYSGLASVSTEIDVKTWYIEFQKNDKPVSNNIVISLDEIYPGMDVVHESVKIMNKGDTDAKLNYSIVSATILGEDVSSDEGSLYIEDKLSQDYPFHINMNLSKNSIQSQDNYSMFDLSVSWPFESSNDELDSQWGNKAYEFQQQELQKAKSDESYQARPSIKVVISVKAEQYIENGEDSDINYNLGDFILYDISKNESCSQISDTCIKTHVVDTNNKQGEDSVALLPDLYGTYSYGTYFDYNSLLSSTVSTWNVKTRALTAKDLLNVISTDVINSYIVTPNISDRVIGNIKYSNRLDTLLNNSKEKESYFRFINDEFTYLSSNKCFWVNSEYNSEKAFALAKIDDQHSKLYGEYKGTSCYTIPVIIAPKSNL